MGHSKSSPKREICSIKDLPQETRKISSKQSKPIRKRIRKRTRNKICSKQKKGNNKD